MKPVFAFVCTFVLGLVLLTGCQSNISSEPSLISPKISDDGLQEIQGIIDQHLSHKNAIRNINGRELDVALVVNPTPEDFKKYPNYRFSGETESGIKYMFLVGDHATDISYEAMGITIFSKAAVPNNPDCRGNANGSNLSNIGYYECTFDLVMSCDKGVTTIRIDGEYHTYSNCG